MQMPSGASGRTAAASGEATRLLDSSSSSDSSGIELQPASPRTAQPAQGGASGDGEATRLLDDGTSEPELGSAARQPNRPDRVPRGAATTLGLCCAVDAADGVLLSTLFRSLERDLGLTPSQLGLVSLCKSVSMSLALPIWGYLSDVIPKARLLTVAVLGWAATSWVVSAAVSFMTLALACALNAAMLGAIQPLSVAYMAELAAPAQRGTMFGFLSLATSSGSVFGQNVGMAASASPWLGIAGWRLPYLCVGLLALPLAVTVHRVLGRRQPAAAGESSSSRATAKLTAGQTWAAVSRIRTVLLIIFQGFFGSIPWEALNFLVIYLQYCGLDNTTAAFTASLFKIGSACGSLAGGYISDLAWKLSPRYGRVALVQFGDAVRLPFLVLIFWCVTS
jgi:MFS family permease